MNIMRMIARWNAKEKMSGFFIFLHLMIRISLKQHSFAEEVLKELVYYLGVSIMITLVNLQNFSAYFEALQRLEASFTHQMGRFTFLMRHLETNGVLGIKIGQ